MKKQLKTLLFIMRHGRMRLGLAKRVRKEREVNFVIRRTYKDWYKQPDSNDRAFRDGIKGIIEYGNSPFSSRYYQMTLLYSLGEGKGGKMYPSREERMILLSKNGLIRPTGPRPEPKRRH